MHVAVLGGGLQGCCLALALAARGARVALYDRGAELLSGAATANEGKIHLGYVYAADRSLATARLMMKGAVSFAPLIARYLECDLPEADRSSPFLYAVHRKSLVVDDAFEAHLMAVHGEIVAAGAEWGTGGACADPAPPRRLSDSERDAHFLADTVSAAFATPEIALDPDGIARALRRRIAADPLIEVRSRNEVTRVEEEGRALAVVAANGAGRTRERYDQVVNALWDGRLRIDAARGMAPSRPWMFRRKHGLRFRLGPGRAALPSATIVLGPFGDVVSYANGVHYASWYPACMTAISDGIDAPDAIDDAQWPGWREALAERTLAALGRIVRPLAGVGPDDLVDPQVRGGVIFAWGETDIDDPESLLHQRFDIGVASCGRYHSVDPGKLTMAPYFAERCARRVLGP